MRDEIKDALATRYVVPLWPVAGTVLGLKKSATYNAAARGDIPLVKRGTRTKGVSTAWLRATVGLEGEAA